MSEHVLDLLRKQGLQFNVSGRDYLIKCLNPDHDDSNPSFRIDKITGISHCFSCGFKVNIFKYFGVVGNFTSIKVAKLKEKLHALHINANGVDFPEEQIPIARSFRGISAKTLKEFGAFYTNTNEKLVDRIFFPIKDLRDKPIAYVGRHMHSSGNPRYLNYPSGVTMPIFPEKFRERYTSAVLVEGIFDMLNCYDKGLKNVVCTFGTSKLLNETAQKMLSYKVMGIEKVYILYDGDAPGREAAKKIKPLIEEAGFTVEIIDLPDDLDPGIISQEYVDSIIEYTK